MYVHARVFKYKFSTKGERKLNYAVIKKNDIANGPGVRVSLFVSGCRHRCKNCFNSQAWDFSYGEKYTEKTQNEILKALSPDYVEGLSLLGGEPFERENAAVLSELALIFKREFPNKTIWAYSGFLFEDLISGAQGDDAKRLLETVDVLVDGKFIEELKSEALLFRGSSNQRIIDVQKSVESGSPVILEGKWERTMGSGDIYEF